MYQEILCNFDNLREAYRLAHQGKTNAVDVIEFDKNKFYNLNKLLKKLQNKEWSSIFRYYRFIITEPKKRVVDAMLFEGRIVQHVLCDTFYLRKSHSVSLSATRLHTVNFSLF